MKRKMSNFFFPVMWIMDRVFKFTNFGVISWMHDDFFIRFELPTEQ